MLKNRALLFPSLFAAAAALLFSSCSAKPPKTAAAPRESAPASPATPVSPPEAAQPPSLQPDVLSEDLATLNRKGYLKDAFFDYDRADLREDARAALAADAQWLKKYGSAKILIEGHCDERGTEEYNLALGDRRANATREYLASLGVPASRSRVRFLREGAAFLQPGVGVLLAGEPAGAPGHHGQVESGIRFTAQPGA